MATTVLKSSAVFRAPPSPSFSVAVNSSASSQFPSTASTTRNGRRMETSSCIPTRCRIDHRTPNLAIRLPRSGSVRNFMLFASDGEIMEADQTETQEHLQDSEIEENIGGAHVDGDTLNEAENTPVDETASTLMNALQSYREALAKNDTSKVADIETFLKSIEDEKLTLEREILTLTEVLSSEKEYVLRISAAFNSFRMRTEREQLSLVTTARGEVLEKLLPVLDNFERAKDQIKVRTKGEEKIYKSYQSIHKQFVEILGSLGVTPVEETIGNPLARFQVGSKFRQMIGNSFENLHKACSGFMKTWT